MKACLGLTGLIVLTLALFAAPSTSAIAQQASGGGASTTQSVAPPKSPEPSAPQGYRLPPEKRAQALAYSHTRYALYFAGVAFALLIYWILWRTQVAVTFRKQARRLSRRHVVQCLLFAPMFLVTVELLDFPFDYYSGYVVEHRFGLSTQSFGSWAADWVKGLVLLLIVGTVLIWIFYAVVRRSPRRWWLYFWALTLPLSLFLMFVEPYVVEPLFYRFTPLEATRPALVARIEKMLGRAGLDIPHSRILEMNASSKTKAINAYVFGLGASKRVVVWDNTLRKLTDDETLLVLGHETGHYVLHHILKEFALIELVALGLMALGFVAVKRLIARYAARSGLEGEGDLASLPLMLLVLTAFSFFASPLVNGISRHYEHQADQFALEVTHGVVPDPNAAEARAFQVLGKQDLADPDPNPFIVFWLYSHPPLDRRIRFALSYKPWERGRPLELLHSGHS